MNPAETERRRGILLLYHRPVGSAATNVDEHISAFARHSAFRVWSVNTEFGWPAGLERFRFDVIVLHYSLFGIWPYRLDAAFLGFLARSSLSYKIAFFQDEHRFCSARFAFLNTYGVQCVYSLLETSIADSLYKSRTTIDEVRFTIPAFVSEELVQAASRFTRPDGDRHVDVGYRGRRLDFYMGRGGQEKHEIGVGVRARAAAAGLTVDIETDEGSRLYGDRWYRFLAGCRSVLGVEAGVSVFDIDDVVRPACERLLAAKPTASFDEVYDRILRPWENNISYRTISPRQFEAAALRVSQILFTGHYAGILKPMVHYIPLQKDFSNWAEVVHHYRNPELRRTLTENAYRDLIESGEYSYRGFIQSFDRHLAGKSLEPAGALCSEHDVDQIVRRGQLAGKWRAWASYGRHYQFPGRRAAVWARNRIVGGARRLFESRLRSA